MSFSQTMYFGNNPGDNWYLDPSMRSFGTILLPNAETAHGCHKLLRSMVAPSAPLETMQGRQVGPEAVSAKAAKQQSTSTDEIASCTVIGQLTVVGGKLKLSVFYTCL